MIKSITESLKRRNTKPVLVNFETALLEQLDDHAKRLGITRTRLIELSVIDSLVSLEKSRNKRAAK